MVVKVTVGGLNGYVDGRTSERQNVPPCPGPIFSKSGGAEMRTDKAGSVVLS